MEENHSNLKDQNLSYANSKPGRENNKSSPPSVSLPVESDNYGITTGSAATAAALAALQSIKGEKVSGVNIQTPLGCLDISVKSSHKISDHSGRASVVKMPYHDPDVTINLEVHAEVHLTDKPSIIITGGEGVGRITKPGLQLPVGEVAINPVPRKMIQSNLEAALPPGKGAQVLITIPQGRKIARRTMNPRLGIVDGISILGTTGIARSMNSESFQKAKKCQLDVALAEGYQELVFVPGNIGEKLARQLLDVEDDQIIQMGNLVGYMLEEASKSDLSKLIIMGHAGKLVKIAGGIFQTEHRLADGRREIITTHTGLRGGNKKVMEEVFNSNTTEDMIEILEREGMVDMVFNSIASSIKERCQDRFDLKPEVIILKMDGTVLNSNYRVELLNHQS
ncbi:Cobalt-precorrin-5B C(1)-methyltransferase [anaerobic digester metagenome]|uniref:cobalt-precorrin-5B (C(1))-methyltransferase CbiD n=1 Tax=Methanobacterium subterraneum TaxID=59277 RepID=UPI000C2CF397|nr:cobalt-precorrin-5B (C(1))-methyltransferase CbiD [Methanobacterium subterraneum]